MSGIIGFVFVVTMCNCIAGLIDRSGLYKKAAGLLRSCRNSSAQTVQAIKRRKR